MTTDTVLTDVEKRRMAREQYNGDPVEFARAIEQAILQSPEVQDLKRDAMRWRKTASHVFEIKRTYEKSLENRVRRLQLDIRKSSISTTKWLEDAVDDLAADDAAMEKQL